MQSLANLRKEPKFREILEEIELVKIKIRQKFCLQLILNRGDECTNVAAINLYHSAGKYRQEIIKSARAISQIQPTLK